MYWQISVTFMSFGDHGGGERNGSQNLCTIVMTHNDLCTCISLTKWDGPVTCVNVIKNVENFQSKCYHFTTTKTSLTVSVKQHEHDKSYLLHVFCWFQRNKDDITIAAQHMCDLLTAAERPSQRRDWNASAIWNHEVSNTNMIYFFLKMYGIPDRHLWNDV